MKYNLKITALFIIFAFLTPLVYSAATVIKLRPGEQRKYDGGSDSYDLYNDQSFIDKIEGSNVYGMSMWYRQTATNDEQMLFHMTFLDNASPWDYSSQTQSYKHLSVPLECKIDTNLVCRTTTFQDIPLTVTNISGFSNIDTWYFIYFGVDQINRQFIVSIISESGVNQKRFEDNIADVATDGIGNEQLDERIKLYVGGSFDRPPTSGCASCINLIGDIFDPTFYVDFITIDPTALDAGNEHYLVLYNEISRLFYINTNQEKTLALYDDYNRQIYGKFGANENIMGESDDPIFDTQNRLTFSETNATFMTLYLDLEFNQSHFISFWVYLDGVVGDQSIFEVTNNSGDLLIGLIHDSANQELFLRSGSTNGGTGVSINQSEWTHVFVAFAFYPLLDNIIYTITLKGALQIGTVNEVLTAIQDDRQTGMNYRFGKSIISPGVSGFPGKISDIFGGVGGYSNFGGTISDCTQSIGIEQEQCIVCDTSFALYEGACLATGNCPDGTYEDTDTRICRNCHSPCLTCNSHTSNSCLSCPEETPILFESHCLSQCPLGSYFDMINMTCTCHPSCSTCTFSLAAGVQCTSCAVDPDLPNAYEYQCVASLNCPYLTFASSGSCVAAGSCGGGEYENYLTRSCDTFCSIGTITYTGNMECLLECPDTFYQDTVTPGNVNETDQSCVTCGLTNNCANCLTLTECLSCQNGYYIHESTGQCASSCQTGFVLDGIICRICQESCTNCPSGYYLHEESCVAACPIGYIPPGSGIECVVNPYPIVEIQSDAIINIGRREDVFVQGYYFFIGEITSEKWALENVSQEEQDKFFFKAFDSYTQILIPYSNLESNKQYTLSYTVTGDNGNSASAQIVINTSTEIATGDFTITPTDSSVNKGISGITEFTIQYSNWVSVDPLQYDIIFGKAYKYTVREQGTDIMLNVNPILLKSTIQSNSFTFTFPPYPEGRTLTVRFRVYSDNEEKFVTEEIELSQFENTENSLTYDFKSDVWWISLQTGLDLQEYIKRSDFLSYLYKEQTDTMVYRGSKTDSQIQKQNLKIMDSQCQDDIQCRGQGICSENFYDSASYQCECFWGMKGQHCNWQDRDLQIMQSVTYQVLFNLQSFTYTDAEMLSLLQILNNLVQVEDGLSKKSFRLLKTMITVAINDLNTDDILVYINLIDTLSNIIYQSITRPTLRPDEKVKYSLQFRGLLDSLLEKIRNNFLRLNEDILIENQFLTVFLTKQYGQQLLASSQNSANHIIFPLKNAVIHYPKSIFNFNEVYILQIIQYDFDPIYPQGFVITSQVEIDIWDQNNDLLVVKNLATGSEVNIFLRKINAFPPIRTDLELYYQCNSVEKIDDETYEWKHDNSKIWYTFENEHFIHCKSTHLSHFGVQRGLLEYLQLPSDQELELFGMTVLDIELKRVNGTNYSTDKNIALSQREYKIYVFPNSSFDFNWDSPCAIIFYVGIFLYILFSIINYYRINHHPITIYTETHQDVLMLSYHPLVSVALLGETFFSHTHQMRMTKLFSLVLSIIAFIAVVYRRLLMADTGITSGQNVMASIFFGGALGTGVNYFWELIYVVIFRAVLKYNRHSGVYSAIFFINMLLVAAYGIYENGMTDKQEYGNYIFAILLALFIDFFIFDMVVVSYAYFKYESPLLHSLSFRGFFIKSNHDTLIPPKVEFEQILEEEEQDLKSNQGDKQENYNDNNELVVEDLDLVGKDGIELAKERKQLGSKQSKRSNSSKKKYPMDNNKTEIVNTDQQNKKTEEIINL